MNSPDPFEEHLARTPFHPAPSSLRERVLQSAHQVVPEPASVSAPAWPWITQWLWLHPVAWGALGLAWMLIFVLQFTIAERPDSVRASQPVQRTVSSAWTAALREQRVLWHSLLQDPPSPAWPPESRPGAQLWRSDKRLGRALV